MDDRPALSRLARRIVAAGAALVVSCGVVTAVTAVDAGAAVRTGSSAAHRTHAKKYTCPKMRPKTKKARAKAKKRGCRYSKKTHRLKPRPRPVVRPRPTPSRTTVPAPTRAPTPTSTPTTVTPTPPPGPTLSLGPGGMVAFPDEATRWVTNHPNDPRAATIRDALVGKPTSLWLTGDESFGNLSYYSRIARERQGTMALTIWNIPLRWDGLGSPSTVASDAYKTWMTKIAQGIGTTRAVLVLEPDALWFYDRLPDAAARQQRLEALQTAITALRTYAPNTRVYLEAGTSSKSVTPARMGQLLDLAGVRQIAGFAVNASSFSPTPEIEAYAQGIRAELQRRGLADPRYVVDTGRNGAATWDYTWCNPDGRRVGADPGLVGAATGLDFRLWIKAPGTSDGDCGNGRGSYGGQFLPDVAYKMITG